MSRSNNPYLISLVSTICDAKLDLVGEMLSNSHTVLQQCLERNILGLFIDWVVSDIRHEIKQIPGNHVRAEPNLNIKVPPVLCSLVHTKTAQERRMKILFRHAAPNPEESTNLLFRQFFPNHMKMTKIWVERSETFSLFTKSTIGRWHLVSGIYVYLCLLGF